MDEAVVVRRDLHVIELARRRELASLREAAEHRAIKLQDLNRLLFQQRAAAISCELTLAGGERYAGPPR